MYIIRFVDILYSFWRLIVKLLTWDCKVLVYK